VTEGDALLSDGFAHMILIWLHVYSASVLHFVAVVGVNLLREGLDLPEVRVRLDGSSFVCADA
jgi:hypothetical protein